MIFNINLSASPISPMSHELIAWTWSTLPNLPVVPRDKFSPRVFNCDLSLIGKDMPSFKRVTKSVARVSADKRTLRNEQGRILAILLEL